jgi:hypothetical protein
MSADTWASVIVLIGGLLVFLDRSLRHGATCASTGTFWRLASRQSMASRQSRPVGCPAVPQRGIGEHRGNWEHSGFMHVPDREAAGRRRWLRESFS